MRNAFLILLIPFAAFADTCHLEQVGGGDWRIVCTGSGLQYNYVDITNDVYVVQDCEQLKQSLLSSASYLSRTIDENFRPDLSSIRSSATDILDNASDTTTINAANEIVRISGSMLQKLDPIHASLIDTSFPDGIAYSINNINCGSCPTNGASGSGSGVCCDVDFTDIIDRLIIAERQRAAISNQISRIINYLGVVTNQLAYNNFLLEHGFSGITNALFIGSRTDDLAVGEFYMRSSYGIARPSRWATYYLEEPASITDVLYVLDDNLSVALASLNNYKYQFIYGSFPVLTNTISAIHCDTTNFFSFFRGEIGVRGVLEDWTNQEADGTYYEFLTNHYINVVRDGPLTGFSVEKTNWFARVETLLAALVFRDEGDTTATNLVDATRYDSEKNQINDSLRESVTYISTPVEKLQEINTSLLEQLQSFSQAFEDAILPSHINLFSIGDDVSRSSSTTSFELTFLVDSDQQEYYNIIRSCTTLVWVFLSLLLIYWFLVWSINKVILIVRFFWHVAEMFMSRNG